MANSLVFSVAETARLLHVSVPTLYNWKRAGRLVPAGRRAGCYSPAYTEEQLRDFLGLPADDVPLQVPRAESISAADAAQQLRIPVELLTLLEGAGTAITAKRSITNRRIYTTEQVAMLRARLDEGGPLMPGISPRAARNLVGRAEAAAFIGVNIRTLYHWERENRLVPVARSGQQHFYMKTQVAAYKEQWQKEIEGTRHISRPGEMRPRAESKTQVLSGDSAD